MRMDNLILGEPKEYKDAYDEDVDKYLRIKLRVLSKCIILQNTLIILAFQPEIFTIKTFLGQKCGLFSF
jgi:hypothetical protein